MFDVGKSMIFYVLKYVHTFYIDMEKSSSGFRNINMVAGVVFFGMCIAVIFIVISFSVNAENKRDTQRQQDVDSLLYEFKNFRNQNEGLVIRSVYNMTPRETYMIVYGDKRKGCDDINAYCDVKVTSDTHCVDLSELVDYGMYEDSPIAPNGNVRWDRGISESDKGIGYTLSINHNIALTITACESEGEGIDQIFSSDLKK